MGERRATRTPVVVGHVGLWTSVVVLLLCVLFLVVGLMRSESEQLPVGASTAPWILYGLLFGPVAALGVGLFGGFLRLPDWSVAPEVPLGLKLLGHLGRVVGSLAAAACVALAALTVVIPDSVPPIPQKTAIPVRGAEGTPLIVGGSEARPGLAALYVLGIFVSLGVRLLGSAVAEQRRWARLGTLVACGGALALLIVGLILNVAVWRVAAATLPLSVFTGLCFAVFFFLLIYFALRDVTAAFEAYDL